MSRLSASQVLATDADFTNPDKSTSISQQDSVHMLTERKEGQTAGSTSGADL